MLLARFRWMGLIFIANDRRRRPIPITRKQNDSHACLTVESNIGKRLERAMKKQITQVDGIVALSATMVFAEVVFGLLCLIRFITFRLFGF